MFWKCFTVAIGHTLTGKSITRALHTHFLLESVLTTELLSRFFPSPELEEMVEADEVSEGFDVDVDVDVDVGSDSEHGYETNTAEEREDEIETKEEDFDDDGKNYKNEGLEDEMTWMLSRDQVSHIRRLYELVGEDYDKGMDCIENSEVF